jgi:hypothetical protein
MNRITPSGFYPFYKKHVACNKTRIVQSKMVVTLKKVPYKVDQ